MDQIGPECRVLDLGCGDGRLLSRLHNELKCSVLGVELDHRGVVDVISKGLPIIKADLDQGLDEIPDHSFDYAVLSQTLQQVRHPKALLQRMLRVARHAVVLVPNFGHWRVRLKILMEGRAPITSSLPYDWYNTPNLHFLSMLDFCDLCKQMQIQIVKEVPIIRGKAVSGAWSANLRADNAVYVLTAASTDQTQSTLPQKSS